MVRSYQRNERLQRGIVTTFLCVLLALYFYHLGNRPFATPDEARYVEIPREMIANDDFITPRLNGVKYFEKPPLLYWIHATFQTFFGINEASMRLPLVLLALLGLFATYLFVRKQINELTALCSAFIIGSSVLFFSLSRLITLDMAVSIFIMLSGYSFYLGVITPFGLRRRLYFYSFTIFCALGVMTKGLMVLAIMGPVILIWATLTQSWKNVFPAYIPSALIIFLSVTGPWHILAALKNPEFIYKYFIYEHFIRYTTVEHMRYQPLWWFLPITFIGLMPWSFFLTKKVCSYRDKLSIFLIIWCLWVLLFFSISHSKLIPYILPLFPPASILIAQNLLDENNFKWNGILMALVGLCALIFLKINAFILPSTIYVFIYLIIIAGSLLCLSSLLFLSSKLSKRNIFYFLSVGHLYVLVGMINEAEFFQRQSIKSFVPDIQAHQTQGVRLISFMTYFQDLPLYTKQIVSVLEAKGELEFGTTVENTTDWMINRSQFEKIWNTEKVIAIGRQSEFDQFQKNHKWFFYKKIRLEKDLLLVKNF